MALFSILLYKDIFRVGRFWIFLVVSLELARANILVRTYICGSRSQYSRHASSTCDVRTFRCCVSGGCGEFDLTIFRDTPLTVLTACVVNSHDTQLLTVRKSKNVYTLAFQKFRCLANGQAICRKFDMFLRCPKNLSG